MANAKFYQDFHYPLPLVRRMRLLQQEKYDAANPQAAGSREWFSQPRVSVSPETECVTITFRLPFSVSEISTEILKMPCTAEIWYLDRSNNWRPVLDTARAPMKVRVDRADTKEWYKWSSKVYPIVAKRVQLRLTRTGDPTLSETPYPVGVRNTLIKRNVYDRNQGGFFEDEVDMMGNVVSKYVRDWDAKLAADDNYTTFWKSAPMPDPEAVASLYLDVRSAAGSPQVIDRVYLDPVYTGQQLNLYYSNDETVGRRVINPITVPPPDVAGAVVNASWKFGEGLTDTSTGTSGQSKYSWTLSVGPQVRQDAWVGVEWRPDFGTVSAPNLAANPTLFQAGTALSGAASPKLFYQVASNARRFVLDLAGQTFQTNAISQEWVAGDSIKVVAGWRYSDSSVYIKVVDAKGRTIASHSSIAATLPDLIGFDGTAKVENFRGTITNLVLKLEDHDLSSESFLASPEFYCDPDPVMPDSNGKYPSTSLDNAVYVAPFLSREHGSGNADQSHFEDKEWTPIWRDYVAVKGMLFFPQPVSMKYLKLEFTNLTEQPYPIYESGIETRYKVFPLSVVRQASWGHSGYTGEGGFLGLGSFISVNGVRSVNWLDPASVMRALGGMVGKQVPPVQVTAGLPYLADVLPNGGAVDVQRSLRIEMGSSYVYTRETLQPYILAEDQYNTIIKAEGLQAIQPLVDIPWKEIEAANPNAVTKVMSRGTTPVRGSDWWIYPGQQLKVPASVMRKLTDTQTVTERKFTLERRIRFNTTSVHRYDYRTLKRDAAVAYFAGVREVQPYIASHISGEDVPVYKFPSYTPEHWVFSPTGAVRQTELGPVTAASASVYGVVTKDMTSQSDFTKVSIDFQDSGLYRSNPMWVDIDEQVDSIPDTQLSPYFKTNPDLPQGKWLDPISTWKDSDISWGSGAAEVQVTIDPDQRFQGRRVVKFLREANAASQAGITVRQWNNFIPGAQMRVGATFYRPGNTTNTMVLQLRRIADGVVVLREPIDDIPSGRWFTATTQFVEIPETITNGSFDSGLAGWTGTGGSWTYVTNKGFTGTNSAKLVTNGTKSTLTNLNKVESLAETTISAAAWITWSGVTPGSTVYLNALLYGNDGSLIRTVELTSQQVTMSTATSTEWHPISGSTTVPVGEGVTQVGFQVVVPAAAGSGGTVWVDDFTFDVPGSPRQQYVAELNLEGSVKEEMYVSDLFTEITPVRYFVRLGPAGTTPIEVTDLRYTQNVTTVTTTTPVNEMRVQAVIASDRCYAYGCTITPHYLR